MRSTACTELNKHSVLVGAPVASSSGHKATWAIKSALPLGLVDVCFRLPLSWRSPILQHIFVVYSLQGTLTLYGIWTGADEVPRDGVLGSHHLPPISITRGPYESVRRDLSASLMPFEASGGCPST